MQYIEMACSILSGVAVCIPLVIKLCATIKTLINNRNWNTLVKLIGEQMSYAQAMYEHGYDRKAYVMNSVNTLAKIANYELQDNDMDKISDMIDNLCDMANVVGKKKEK